MSDQANTPVTVEQLIRVLIVDDQRLVRESLTAAIDQEADLLVLGSADNAGKAIELAVELRPDVVLLDIDMPGISCFDAIRALRPRLPEARFILVTAFEHDQHLDQALQVKVDGFVVKTEGVAALAAAIRSVHAGIPCFSKEVMERIVVQDDQSHVEGAQSSRLSTLTPRECELLRALARGLSLKEAASLLSISYKTADRQKVSIMAKLDIHDRVELARFAIREGLVEA